MTSLVGRYGKHLQGSDAKGNGHVLEGGEFDEEAQVDLEEMGAAAQQVTQGNIETGGD